MDDLKFIEMFGEIDEKIVQEANDDLNFWQETREGVVVCVGNSRRSPLRIVFASVACAAVVFGAVFFMRNFLKNGFTYVPGGPGRSSVQSEESSNGEDTYTINSDVMWAIGKTFDEVTDRYGEVAGGNIFEYSFENGYGVYVWDVTDHSHSDLNENISLARESGGCKAIANISAGDLLTGDLSTVNLDNIAQKYGFDVVPLNSVPEGYTMYDDYIFAYYTHPSYENLTFIMCYKKSGFDEKATFHIRYGYDIKPDDENLSDFVSEPLSRTECEQIVTLFKAWGDLNYNIHPDPISKPGYFPECLDSSQFITEEITRKGSIMTYTEYFYLIASGEFSTEEGFNRKLDGMFSEKFKERYMGCSSWQDFRFKDGEAYVSGFNHYTETEPEIHLLLDIKSVDENTVALNISDIDEDNARKNTATLIRSENGGFKIDDVGRDDGSLFDIPSLFHHKNVQTVVNWQGSTLYVLD